MKRSRFNAVSMTVAAGAAALAVTVISLTPTPAYACGGFMQAKCPPPKAAPRAAVVRPGTTPTLAVQNKPVISTNGSNGIVASGAGNLKGNGIVASGAGNLKGNGIVSSGGGNMRK